MSTKKKKATRPHLLLASEEAMLGALNRYCTLRLDVERRTAKHERDIAKLNTEFDESIQSDREELAGLETSLQLFAQNHREKLFNEPKSRSYPNAVLGFRISPPSVGRVVEKEKWDIIAERVESLPWGEPYVKEGKPSLNKEAILRDRQSLTQEQLAEAGLKIEQGETFFIEPTAASADRHVAEATKEAA